MMALISFMWMDVLYNAPYLISFRVMLDSQGCPAFDSLHFIFAHVTPHSEPPEAVVGS